MLAGSAKIFAGELSKTLSAHQIDLEIATKQKGRSVSGGGIYIFKLFCGGGDCKLEVLTLNACKPDANGVEGFYPKVYTFSSQAGFLEIQSFSKDSLNLVVFQSTHKTSPAHLSVKFVPKQPFAETATYFRATDFLDFSDPHLSALNNEYIPIYGPPHLEKIDCPLRVPGFQER